MKKAKNLFYLFLAAICLILLPAGKVEAATGWMSVCKPYQYTNTTEYLPTSSDCFKVGGAEYREGYVFYLWNAARTSQVLYNLKGMYSSFSFDVGHVDGTNNYSANLEIYLDGVYYTSIALSSSDISKHVTIPVDGINHLKIAMTSDEALNHYDITYGLFNGNFQKNGVTAAAIPASNWVNNCEPYNYANEASMVYEADNQYLTMGGDNYTNAMKLYMWNGYEGRNATAYFNLQQSYESLSFVVGHVDNTTRATAILTVTVDGKVVKTVELLPDALPQSVNVSLSGASQLALTLSSNEALNVYDITYGIGAAVLKSNGHVRGIILEDETLNLTYQNPSSKLTAHVVPADANNTNVTWTSSDTSIATVNNQGLVTAIGNGTAIITATTQSGGYSALCTVNVTGMPVHMTKTAINISDGHVYYGSEITPEISVTYDGNTLKNGTDYTVVLTNNINAGTATATFTGIGDYNGTVAKTFVINKATQDITTNVSKTTLAVGKSTQIQTSGYGTITYVSSKPRIATVSSTGKIKAVSPGTVTITVKADGGTNYDTDSETIKITVNPKATKILTAKNTGKKQVTVKWQKVSGVTGYEIRYVSGSTKKIATVKKAAASSKKIKKLTVGRTYKISIRTYKKVGGKKYYSAWSKVKKVKITK